jgi:DNA-binding transcriptional LysR family regulator
VTRAIKSLEAEVGGDLFRREGALTHLTDLGNRLLPMLQRCYDAAIAARTAARPSQDPAAQALRSHLRLGSALTCSRAI